MSPFLLVRTPRPLEPANLPMLLSEVEQEQRLSGNGDREAIVVRACPCDFKGERAYPASAPQFDIFAFRIFFETRITSKTLDASLKK